MPRENFLRDIEAPIVCVDTDADLSAFPVTSSDGHPYPSGTLGIVGGDTDTPTRFRLRRNSGAVVNGTTVLAANGPAAARWLFESSAVSVASGSMFRDTNVGVFASDAAWHPVTGWDGSNSAAVGVGVSLANGRFTIAQAGRYRVSLTGQQTMTIAGAVVVQARIYNVTDAAQVPGFYQASEDSAIQLAMGDIVDLDVGDVLEYQVQGEVSVNNIGIVWANFAINQL